MQLSEVPETRWGINMRRREIRSDVKDVGWDLKTQIRYVRSEVNEVGWDLKMQSRDVMSEVKELRSEMSGLEARCRDIRFLMGLNMAMIIGAAIAVYTLLLGA